MSHEIRFTYDAAETPEPLCNALELLAEDFPVGCRENSDAIRVSFSFTRGGPTIGYRDGAARLSGTTIPHILRALATLRGFARDGEIPRVYEEPAFFDSLGLMLDASRNAVPNVSTVKFLLRRMALMGLNTFMLYTEDTYEVPDQPYVGYLRGRYTHRELGELDEYAAKLGIEMIPCIQTLAHLAQMLRWPAFDAVKDTVDILLVEDECAYVLLEQMIAGASAPYRSKRIHIGMDEAQRLGTGRYQQLHGVQSRFDIMTRHLRRVAKITDRLGLKPMMWSDMFFRIASNEDDYYDIDARIPTHITSEIPPQVRQVYWDYYHIDKEFYAEWIDRHRALGMEPVFAGGLWTWGVFWQNLGLARITTDAAMCACKEKGVREAFTTAWGDDGNEVDVLSMLPGLQRFAEHGYSTDVWDSVLERQCFGSTGWDINTWILGRFLDETPGMETLREIHSRLGMPLTPYLETIADCNDVNWAGNQTSKWLLWQDPLLGLFDRQIEGIPLSDHYRSLSMKLKKALGTARQDCVHTRFVMNLSEVLEDKSELGLRLLNAYKTSDRAVLTNLCDTIIPRLIRKLKRLHEQHRRVWFSLYKPQGWEHIDARYGTLETRLDSTRMRIHDYLSGSISLIDELEETRLACFPATEGRVPHCTLTYNEIISPGLMISPRLLA